jgi:DNA-directed RNA polymerase beta subunit
MWAFFAEVASHVDKKSTRTVKVAMRAGAMAKGKAGGDDQTICVMLPYVLKEIPVFVVFRALGIESDKEILQYICYDIEDADMLDLLRPSLLEAKADSITTQTVGGGGGYADGQDALAFIGARMQQGEMNTLLKRAA